MPRQLYRLMKVTAYQLKINKPSVEWQGDTLAITPVTPNGIIIRGGNDTAKMMRMQFKIEKSTGSEPNKCDLTISNLARGTRQSICIKPAGVLIEAGYGDVDDLRQLYVGDLRHGYSKQDGPTWNTILQYGDGDRAYRYGKINKSYRAGTKWRTVLRDVAASMGFIIPGDLDADTQLDNEFSAGLVLSGAARHELTRLLAPFGYSWSIQDNQLRVIRNEDSRDDGRGHALAHMISVATGMNGSPEWSTPEKGGKPSKLSVKLRLNPLIQPGHFAQVVSQDCNGIFRVSKVSHDGDTHGSDWDTTLELKTP